MLKCERREPGEQGECHSGFATGQGPVTLDTLSSWVPYKLDSTV